MQDVATHDFVSVRSGHKVGKSRFDAGLALWWLTTRRGAKVVVTSVAGHQVENILWPEIRALYLNAEKRGFALGGRLYDDYHKGIRLEDGRTAFGLTTRDPEAFAGISSPNSLFIVDEASGFPEAIFTSVFGNLAGGGKAVLTGNPTRTTGTFYDTHHSKRGHWKSVHISSLETPNFFGGKIPGLATPKWADWARKEWGEGTPAWCVRVLGQFPSQDAMTIIGLGLLEDALLREILLLDTQMVFGLDVARFGDDQTILTPRQGWKVHEQIVIPPADGPNTAGLVLEEIRKFKCAEPPIVNVDAIGYGAGAYDTLARSDEVKAFAVNSASSASDPSKFHNMRAQLWFGARDFLKEGGTFASNPTLEGELVAARYKFDSQGRYQVEEKDEIKKTLKRSPDRADSFCLCVQQQYASVNYEELLKAFEMQRRA